MWIVEGKLSKTAPLSFLPSFLVGAVGAASNWFFVVREVFSVLPYSRAPVAFG
jgi:hypothetical protein